MAEKTAEKIAEKMAAMARQPGEKSQPIGAGRGFGESQGHVGGVFKKAN